MQTTRNRRPSASIIVAVIALVFAVAGTAIAVPGALEKLDKKEKKAVTKIAAQQANQAIIDQASGLSVKSAKTADSATTAKTASAIATDSVKAGSFGTLTRRTNSVEIVNNTGGSVSVTCDPGEQVITGGTDTTGVGTATGFSTNRSTPDPNGWTATARNNTGSDVTFTVVALCLAP